MNHNRNLFWVLLTSCILDIAGGFFTFIHGIDPVWWYYLFLAFSRLGYIGSIMYLVWIISKGLSQSDVWLKRTYSLLAVVIPFATKEVIDELNHRNTTIDITDYPVLILSSILAIYLWKRQKK